MRKKYDFYHTLKQYQLSKQEHHYHLQNFLQNNCQTSKQKIIKHYLPMALKICVKLQKKHPFIDLFDLFNQSYLIMHQAIEKYKLKQFINLSTFFYKHIQWKLNNYINKQYQTITIPERTKKKLKKDGISLNPIYLSELSNYDIIKNDGLYFLIIDNEEEED